MIPNLTTKPGMLRQAAKIAWLIWLTHDTGLVQLLATSSANISNIDFKQKKTDLGDEILRCASKKSHFVFGILGRDGIHRRNPGIKGGMSLSPQERSLDPGTDTCLPRTGSQ